MTTPEDTCTRCYKEGLEDGHRCATNTMQLIEQNQTLKLLGQAAMDSVGLAIRGGLDISHPKREEFLAYVRSMPRVAAFLEALKKPL